MSCRRRSVILFFVFFHFCISFGYIALRHFVSQGETLESICSTYRVPFSVFLDWNQKDTPIQLKAGSVVQIPFPSGYVYSVTSGDTLSLIANAFFADTNSIAVTNALQSPFTLKVNQLIFIPVTEVGKKFFFQTNKLLWPVYGEITSPYGTRVHPITNQKSVHTGLDISASPGTPVFAAEGGKVVIAGLNGGYGNMIEISASVSAVIASSTASYYQYRYGHLSEISVIVGQTVKKGDLIARVGSTGVSTGPHLHFEIRNQKEETVNPLPLLPDSQYVYPKH